MRIHFIAAIAVVAMGKYFNISALEWIALAIVIGNVFSKETTNSSLEDVVELSCMDHNAKARDAKDKAAGAVLYSAMSALIVGLVIFIPKIIALYA